MRNVVLILMMVATVSSCKKKCENHHTPDLCAEPQIGMGDCITDSNQLKSLLPGKWNWTQTSVWGQTANPCTETLHYTYEFLQNGYVRIHVDGNYAATSLYSFHHVWTSEISITDTAAASANPAIYNAGGAIRLCGNYLIIDNSPVDGPRIVFLREN